jgi:hypothetical protein
MPSYLVQSIREFLRERDIPIAKILHEANCASHELAKIGRVEGRTETWLIVSLQTLLWPLPWIATLP